MWFLAYSSGTCSCQFILFLNFNTLFLNIPPLPTKFRSLTLYLLYKTILQSWFYIGENFSFVTQMLSTCNCNVFVHKLFSLWFLFLQNKFTSQIKYFAFIATASSVLKINLVNFVFFFLLGFLQSYLYFKTLCKEYTSFLLTRLLWNVSSPAAVSFVLFLCCLCMLLCHFFLLLMVKSWFYYKSKISDYTSYHNYHVFASS